VIPAKVAKVQVQSPSFPACPHSCDLPSIKNVIYITNDLIFVMQVILYAASESKRIPKNLKGESFTMKKRMGNLFKSMFVSYCNTFKDVPPGAMF